MSVTNLNLFLSPEAIEEIVVDLAAQINRDYLSIEGELILVLTLKGSLLFGADLARHLNIPVRIEFVRVGSYGTGTTSSGKVRLISDIDCSITGQHVLILDEIVDTGRTIDFLLNHYASEKPASLKICALLSKPSRREIEVPIHYCGRDVEDKFLVGYGLDHAEKYRNLSAIFSL